METPAWLICALFLICGHSLFSDLQTYGDYQGKNTLVEIIAQKVGNLSPSQSANAPTKDNSEILFKIEENLNNSAKLLGHMGNEYVKLIMKGLKINSFNNDKENKSDNNGESNSTEKHSDDKLTAISNYNGKNTLRRIPDVDSKPKVINQTSKDKLINDIVKKMKILANNYHKGAKTKYARQKAVELIKHHFEETAKQKRRLLCKQHDEIKSYVELVGQGIQVISQKIKDNGKNRKMDHLLNDEIIKTNRSVSTSGEIENIWQDKSYILHNNDLDKERTNENVEKPSRRQGTEGNKDNITTNFISTTWSPSMCECNGQNCNKMCSQECELVCWHKYSLSRWQCQAVNGERSVAIDSICNGKIDCYDKTDESDCSEERSLAKYKAIQIYNKIPELIMAKALMTQYQMIRNNLLTLHDLILKLQKLSLTHYADVDEVKRVRENCFTEMTMIYDSAIQSASTTEEIIEIYKFLLDLNEKLVSALKRSQGHDKSISGAEEESISSNGCLCKNNECTRSRCSPSCSQFCAAQSKLTRYFCGESTSLNKSVSINALCNGKADCPDNDDEENCSEEVCRSHHIILLRHNLREAGEEFKGSAMGEALIQWKTKVSAKLMISEGGSRPTPSAIQDLVQEILQELLTSYASINDNRRSDGSRLDEYVKWSRVAIGAVKSCGH